MFGKLTELRQIAQEPSQSQYVQALVDVVVNLEHRLLTATSDLHDAQGIDDPLAVTSTTEERREMLLGMADAAAQTNLQDYWLTEVVDGIENVEEALPLAGLPGDEWEDQVAAWAEMYRAEAPERFEDDSDREIADEHTRRTFGVPLDEFEAHVVNYSRQQALKTALAGNFQQVENGIERATDHARDGGER